VNLTPLFACDGIDVRRGDIRATERADVVVAQVVGENQHDVGFVGCIGPLKQIMLTHSGKISGNGASRISGWFCIGDILQNGWYRPDRISRDISCHESEWSQRSSCFGLGHADRAFNLV